MSTFLAAVAMVACGEAPKTFVPSHTDVFTYDTGLSVDAASAIYQADYLFVLDYSSSMQTKKDSLLGRMDRFVDRLGQENNDYRIGFVKGNAHGCAGGTNAGCSKKTVADNFVHTKFLEPGTSSTLLDEILNHVATLGDPNSLPPNTPVMLEAAHSLLSTKGSSFLRSSAQLILVFLSDQDDESNQWINSNRTVDYYKSKFRALKSDPSYISARALVAGVAPGCTLQNQGGLDPDVAGQRIANVALGINGNAAETNVVGCVYDDEATMLEGLARDVQRYTNRFALQQAPMQSTLSVRVGNVSVASESGWRYEPATNEVVFTDAAKPGPSQSLAISYEVAYTLKANAKPDSITVSVGGQTIPRSDSNGWSYIESENRIRFNGSSAPAEGTEIRVNYEAR